MTLSIDILQIYHTMCFVLLFLGRINMLAALAGLCPYLETNPQIEIKFGPNLCDGDIGCPQEGNTGYETHELYKCKLTNVKV